MLLSDLGAEVVRVGRTGAPGPVAGLVPAEKNVLHRGRREIALDLKKPEAIGAALRLVERADALLEGYRPGVMERLGLGPEPCLGRNPQLVYGRMTGWGQEGPLARAAGHDIDYVAISGALHAVGTRNGGPVPSLNLVGDFGGGGMLLALGVTAALLEARRSGQGQVVDAAMSDGAALLMAGTYALRAASLWSDERGSNFLDGGAHFYGTYECADGKWLAVGAIEPQFYALLLRGCGLDGDPELARQWDRSAWPALKEKLAAVFRRKSRDAWCALLEGTDACVAPVLDLAEAPEHPHHRARGTFVEIGGVLQPAPAPRFSRTRAEVQGPPAPAGADTAAVLAGWGFTESDILVLRERGAIG